MYRTCIVALGLLVIFDTVALAKTGVPSPEHSLVRAGSEIQILRSTLAGPEDKIDFAKAKLTIDKLVDPHTNINTLLGQIDQMVRTVRAMAGPNASAIKKLAAVRRFIYESGDWNDHKPFQYDLSDPLGTKLANKLLSTYLATRRGNCASMPVLFVILADRLGVHVALSTAPFHLFVKFIDDATGATYNLETTSGGYPARDIWYKQKMAITDEAVRNGVYLKTLSRKEAVAVMAELLMEHYVAQKRYPEIIEIADLITHYYPNNVDATLTKGSVYGHLIETEFKQKYPRPVDIPQKLLPKYQSYVRENEIAFQRAEALGWREEQSDAGITR